MDAPKAVVSKHYAVVGNQVLVGTDMTHEAYEAAREHSRKNGLELVFSPLTTRQLTMHQSEKQHSWQDRVRTYYTKEEDQ